MSTSGHFSIKPFRRAKTIALKIIKKLLTIPLALLIIIAFVIFKTVGIFRKHEDTNPYAPSKAGPTLKRDRVAFLYRRPRSECDIKHDGSSWFGGRPALGDVEWPRDQAGNLMHHVLQIDLAEVGPFVDLPGLPTKGSFAVFVALGENMSALEIKVCYVAEPNGETEPSEALEPIGNFTSGLSGGLAVHSVDPDILGTLPRWTIDVMCLEIDDDTKLENQFATIGPCGSRRYVSTYSFIDSLPNGRDPSYWHSAQLFAQSLDQAVRTEAGYKLYTSLADDKEQTLNKFLLEGFPQHPNGDSPTEIQANVQAEIDKYRGLANRAMDLKPEMEAAAKEIKEWAFANDAWDVMSSDDHERFKAYFGRYAKGEYGSDANIFYRSTSGSYAFLDYLADATFVEMMRGPDEIFHLLPEEVQRAIGAVNPEPGMTHQMFGPPGWIQDAASDHMGDHLLFQIIHDEVVGLHLGDVGHIQIWISPEDLAACRWDAITATFEAH